MMHKIRLEFRVTSPRRNYSSKPSKIRAAAQRAAAEPTVSRAGITLRQSTPEEILLKIKEKG